MLDLLEPISSEFHEIRGVFSFSDSGLEAAYRDQKFSETRFLVILVGFAASGVAVILWSWDWVIDPSAAARVFWLRLLLGAILLAYPLSLIAGVRRQRLIWLYAAMVLSTEGVFLYLLSYLETGVVYGIAGFMYWFIIPVFLGLAFSARANATIFLSIAILPNILVPLGVSPAFELIKYNALIWPTCFLGIFITLLLDQLYRRIFLYRRQAERLARLDGLTGIANRRYFMEFSAHMIETCRRQRTSVSVIMIDIDHFKAVNDNYGHPAGDKAIRQMSEFLQNNIRKSDFPGRYGGEEFAVILPQTPPDQGFHVADKIRQKFMEISVPANEGDAIRLTISAGVSGVVSVTEEISLEALIKHADDALYLAKRSGRNRVVLHGSAEVLGGVDHLREV